MVDQAADEHARTVFVLRAFYLITPLLVMRTTVKSVINH
jgi:hypothetical protein